MEVIKYIFTHFWAWLGFIIFVLLVIDQVGTTISECITAAKKNNEIVYTLSQDTFEKICLVLDEIGIQYKDDDGYFPMDKVLKQLSDKWDEIGE